MNNDHSAAGLVANDTSDPVDNPVAVGLERALDHATYALAAAKTKTQHQACIGTILSITASYRKVRQEALDGERQRRGEEAHG